MNAHPIKYYIYFLEPEFIMEVNLSSFMSRVNLSDKYQYTFPRRNKKIERSLVDFPYVRVFQYFLGFSSISYVLFESFICLRPVYPNCTQVNVLLLREKTKVKGMELTLF